KPSTMLLRAKFSKDNLSISVADGTATSRPKGWSDFPTGLCDNERCDATSVPGVSFIIHWLQVFTNSLIGESFTKRTWTLLAAIPAVYARLCCNSIYYGER
ncbi:hypothetical protein EBZ39_19210, partial [bacterium]|nr:hypothetical protein [bacterium]